MCLPITYLLFPSTNAMVSRSRKFISRHQTTLSSRSSRHHWTSRAKSFQWTIPLSMKSLLYHTLTKFKISKIIILRAPILTNWTKLVNRKTQLHPSNPLKKRLKRPTMKSKVRRRKPSPQTSRKTRTKTACQPRPTSLECSARLTLSRRKSRTLLSLPLEPQRSVQPVHYYSYKNSNPLSLRHWIQNL